jgi:ATP synthase protein I
MADHTPQDGDRANRSSNEPSSDEASLSARLHRLDKQLSGVRKDRETQTDQSERNTQNLSANASAMARGFRLSSELIAGVLVGAVIGWSIDRWLSSSPWGLMIFLLLGFAAGVLNVMRAAGVAQNVQQGNDPDSRGQ